MVLFLLFACLTSQVEYEDLLARAQDADGDGFAALEYGGQDCADDDSARFPGQIEHCNGLDDDCDSVVDEDPQDAAAWYQDQDGDGFGDVVLAEAQCVAPLGFVGEGGDCDDLRADVGPGATEVCDGVDNSCNGLSDDEDPEVDPETQTSWFPDVDGDGYGDAGVEEVLSCLPPTGMVSNSQDCDDSDSSLNPDATEICNDGVDNDCSGEAPECIFRGSFSLEDAEVQYSGGVSIEVAAVDTDLDGQVELVLQDGGVFVFEEIGSTPVLEQEDAVWTLPDATGSFRRLIAVPPQEEGYGGFAQASPAAKTVEVYLGSVEGLQASPSLRLTSSAANTEFGSRLVPLSGELGGEEVSLAVTAPSSGLVGGFVYIWTSLPEEDDTETSADLVIGSDSSEFFGTTSGGALGDLNGDGSNAVVVPGDSSVYIFSDLVAGGQSVVLSDASTVVVGVGESRLGTRPAVGDLTGDGYADLFVGSGEGASQSVLLFQGGTGLGSELSSTDAAIVFEGGDFDMGSVLAIADADGNGVEDLVMGGIDGVVLFYGPLGARTKVEQADAQISGLGEDGRVCFEHLVLLDVNSDSTADLVATCAVVMPSTTEILLGRGP